MCLQIACSDSTSSVFGYCRRVGTGGGLPGRDDSWAEVSGVIVMEGAHHLVQERCKYVRSQSSFVNSVISIHIVL